MAKQYIPGVSGLLTEPNPADSPSNTLSEAENVVIDQSGKVQARHGLNVIEKELDAEFYDDINAISDVSLGGDFQTSYSPSSLINNASSNLLPLNQTILFGGSKIYGTPRTISGLVDTLTYPSSIALPYPITSDITYYFYNITDDTTSTSVKRNIKFSTTAKLTNIINDSTIPTNFSFFIKRFNGSCIFTVVLGISPTVGVEREIPVTFNLDTLTYQTNSLFNSSYIKFIDAKVSQYNSTTWYKVSISCAITVDATYPNSTLYTQIYPRLTNRDSNGLETLTPQYKQLPTYNGSSYYNLSVTSWTSLPSNQTELTVTSLSSYPYLRIGDFLRFFSGQVPLGLTANTSYKIISVNSGTNKIRISHPGQTSSNGSGSYSVSSLTDVYVSYFSIYQSAQSSFGENYITAGTNDPVYVASTSPVVMNYLYTSQYTNILPFIKLLEYKDSNDNVKTILFAKQTVNSYISTNSGIYSTSSTDIKNRYYLVDDKGNLGKYETLKYSNIQNVFNTKETVYLHTENGIAEANVDDIDRDINNKFFDIKWPAFPDISFKLTKSETQGNWLLAGYKCKVCITFYRETGYTDKQGYYYESPPSVPLIIQSPSKNSIPSLFIDFKVDYESTESYRILNEFTEANKGRKFGIRVYRTEIIPIDEEFTDDFYQCFQDIPFQKFMASSIYLIDKAADDNSDLTEFALRDALSMYQASDQSQTLYLNNLNALPIELEIGDYVNICFDSSQSTNPPYRVYSADKNYNRVANIEQIYPSKYTTTDTNFLKRDYKPARLQVISKKYKNIEKTGSTGSLKKSFAYKFKSLDYIYNERRYVPGLGFVSGIFGNPDIILPNTIITASALSDLLVTNPGQSHENDDKILISRSYLIDLTLNDDGILDQPQLYTNYNIEGSTNANTVIPKSEKSISYHGIQVYHNVQSSLTANIYLTKQPKYEQVYFHQKNIEVEGGLGGVFVFSRNEFNFPSQNIVFPEIVNSVNPTTNQRLFIDSPVFTTPSTYSSGIDTTDLNGNLAKDAEVVTFNTSTNTLVTSRDCVRIVVDYPGATTSKTDANTFLTYRINATMYEQSKLTLKLTSISGTVDTISIKTVPIYNRKGYYSKYTANGTADNDYLYFDSTPNEANGIQLTNYKELANRHAYRVSHPTPKYDAGGGVITTPVNTLSSLNSNMAFGIFNVPGDKDGQYPSNGNIKGFTTTQATTSRGLFFDETNGKLVIRTDATLGSTSNTFDLKAFTAPGYVLIQYNQSDGTTIDGSQTITGWKNIRTIICSYQTVVQSTNNIYEFTGIKTVMYNFDKLKSQTSIHSSVVFDLFFIKAESAETITLYPYGNPPNTREAYISIFNNSSSSKYSAVLNEYVYDRVINDFGVTSTFSNSTSSNSPNEPFFTFHPHKNRFQEPIAFLSPNYSNHKFFGKIKSQTTLWDEYIQSIIDGFNSEFRLKNINASLRKGTSVGEFIIDYPDGQKIEMRSDYGSHEFYPNLNPSSTFVSGSTYTTDFVLLAERTNKEYSEKNLIKWSRRNIPEITTSVLYAYLGKSDKSIIGSAANTDDVYIFKEDGIWRCTDNGNVNSEGNNDLPNIATFVFSNNIICQASGSIQEINDEIIFLSQYGFMSIVSGGIQNISQAIQNDILTLLQITPKHRIRSFVNEAKNIYYCTLINESDSSLPVKSGTYIFNIRTRQWTFMDEEVLDGIQDSSGRTLAAYRQRPVNAKLLNRVEMPDGTKPIFDFTQSHDSNNRLVRSSESEPLDMFYISREQYTNNIKSNAIDQYDYISEIRVEGSTNAIKTAGYWIKKSGVNEFYIRTESIPSNTIFRNKFRTSVEHALMPSYASYPAINEDVSIVDSFVTLFANRSVYLKRINGSSELMQIRVKKTNIEIPTDYPNNSNTYDPNMLVYFEFVDTPPTWFSSMSIGYFNTNGTATYQIIAGVPSKIVFNPESGNQPDSNKLFQEFMIHTETNNKGALMSFKTDSQSSFTVDRRFVYDNAATNRNVFRTYIPTKVARGRYLIRQVKHDLPLENLIITGQTIVMRDSGSTRVQKDKDDA